jgi:hypothetical protein
MTDQLIPGDLTTRTKVITGLRQLADYLDTHPDLPVARYGWDCHVYTDQTSDTDARAEVDTIAAVLGVNVDDRTSQRGHYTAARTFGLVTYEAVHVPAQRMADHNALMSYSGCVQPDGQVIP